MAGFVCFFSAIIDKIADIDLFVYLWTKHGCLIIKEKDIIKLIEKLKCPDDANVLQAYWKVVNNNTYTINKTFVKWISTYVYTVYMNESQSDKIMDIINTKDNIDINNNTCIDKRLDTFKTSIYELAKSSTDIKLVDSYAIASIGNVNATNKVAEIIKNINNSSNIVIYAKRIRNNKIMKDDTLNEHISKLSKNIQAIKIVRDDFDMHDRYIVFNKRAVRMSRGAIDITKKCNIALNYCGTQHSANINRLNKYIYKTYNIGNSA